MDAMVWLLLVALLAAAPAYYFWQRHRAVGERTSKPRVAEARDTVIDWPPTATRLLSNGERQAHALLCQAVPELLVLAQVPLSRFIRVPTRYSYGDWLGRVGHLSADLVVCDASSQVLSVVEVRGVDESPRSLQRHQRMTRVLKAAGIQVLVWPEDQLPTPQAARQALLPQEAARAAKDAAKTPAAADAQAPSAAEGAAAAGDEPREPPPTTWYSDLDPPTGGQTPPRG
jgi:hypothetical protein